MSRTMKQALIVEDDQDVARELSSLLNDMGFKVTTLDDASLAAEKLSTHQFEVALVNKTLPEESWQSTSPRLSPCCLPLPTSWKARSTDLSWVFPR